MPPPLEEPTVVTDPSAFNKANAYHVEKTFTTLVDYVVPIVGIYVGYIFLDEIVSNIFFITLVLIFISLYLAVKDEAKSQN